MSQEKLNQEIDAESREAVNSTENKGSEAEQSASNGEAGEITLAVKKKRFKKSDILVFCACLVTSILVWLYASGVQNKDDQNKIDKGDMLTKDDLIEVVESGMNKATETATDIAE